MSNHVTRRPRAGHGYRYVVMMLALLLGTGAAVRGQESSPNPYQIIDEQSQAEDVFEAVKAELAARWGFQVSRPVTLKLVDPKEMDALFSGSPYKGAEIGLYVSHPTPTVYVMKGWNRDKCSGVTAHEYTHAWQHENVPDDQVQAVREGFAMWIQHKYLDKIGAYTESRVITEGYEDPVYGVGIKTMLAWEDKVGEGGMVELVKKVHTLADGPK